MGGGSSLVLDNANRTAVVESKAASAPTNPKPQPQLQRASPSNSNSSASKLALKDKQELDPSLKELLNPLKAAQEPHPTPIGPKLQSEPAFNRAAVAQLTPQRVSALIDSASAPALVDSLGHAQGPDSFAQPGKSHSSNNKGKTKPVLEQELPLAFDSTETPLKRNEKEIRREEDLTRKKVARGLEIEERKAKEGRSFSINFRKRRYKDGGVAKQKLEEKTSEEFTWRTIGESVEGETLAETPKNTASKKTV